MSSCSLARLDELLCPQEDFQQSNISPLASLCACGRCTELANSFRKLPESEGQGNGGPSANAGDDRA
jgi:hypothetical protein